MSERPAGAPETAHRTTSRPGLVLSLVLICQLMFILDATVMNVALPHIRANLGFTPTGLAWIINAYSLTYGGLLLLGGRVGDLYGRRRVFIIGVAVFSLASLAGGLALTPSWLIIARVVQAAGAALAGPSTLAILATTFTEEHARTRALALFSAMTSGGFAIGLLLGGVLTQWLGWRSVLFINVPFGLVVIGLALRYLPSLGRRPTQLDVPGALTGTVSVASLVYGFIRAADRGWLDAGTLSAMAAGVVLLAVFLLLEQRSRQPLMPFGLFTEHNRRAAYGVLFLASMSMMAVFFFLTQFLQEIRHLSAFATGIAFLPIAITLFAASRLSPLLLRRYGAKPVAVTGTMLMITALAWLSTLSPGSGYLSTLLGPMVLLGLGSGFAFSPMNILVMATVPPEHAGSAGGVLQTLQQIGTTLGLALLVTLFGAGEHAATRGGASAASAMVSGMGTAFVGAAVVVGVTFLLALTFRKTQAQPQPQSQSA